MPKEFHLGDIISVAGEPKRPLVSPTGMDGLYGILIYMAGEDLHTHQLKRVADECRPVLQDEMPWLKEIDTSVVTPDNWKLWLEEQVKKYGKSHVVYPLHPEDHETIDPEEELKKLRPQGGVFKIDPKQSIDPDYPDDSFLLN